MIPYKVVNSLDEVIIDPAQPVFADIETQGLYINTRLVQLFQENTIYILDTDIIPLDEIKELLKPLHLVFHNASYDLGTLNLVPREVDDTQYLARIAYPEWQRFALDDVVTFLGHNKLYEGMDKKAMQSQGFVKGAYLSDRQLRYSATDVYALSLIWKNKKFQNARKVMAYIVDILNLKYAIRYQQNNLLVDQASVRKELDKLIDIIAENEKALGGLNPNSPKQVTEFLGTENSKKETLIRLITETNLAPMAQLVYDQRRLLKRRTFLKSYNYPYVTTRFNPAGAATGRFTSKGGDLERGINAQQIARDLQYIFNQDTEDTVVVHADFSTAELRAGCSIMKDTKMYEELKAGKDLHKIAATLALGGNPEDVTKADRQKGRAISFGFIFGMSAPSFVEYAFTNYGVKFTQEEAKTIKANYQNRYQGIASYAKKWWNDYKTKPVVTPLGHRNTPRLGTDAINYATQGCIAETTKLAIHYLVKENPEMLSYIYNVVHDAIYLRVPRGQEEELAHKLVGAMQKGWREMCKCPMLYYKDIPMPVEVEYGGQTYEFG